MLTRSLAPSGSKNGTRGWRGEGGGGGVGVTAERMGGGVFYFYFCHVIINLECIYN